MNSPSDQVIPWQLNVARFLAPLVAGWAGYRALASLFRDRIQQMRIPMMRGHVVICGLGKYVGTIFLRHLRDHHFQVVVIEQDVTNPNIELCRSWGVPVIIGDAQRRKTLQEAGAHRAWRVLAVADDDAVNTQIVATWRKLPRRGSRQTGCLARISNPDFCSLLRLHEAEARHDRNSLQGPAVQRGQVSSVDFFNIDEIGAREMLEKYPPFGPGCSQPHILVAHLDPLGVWLVWHAARLWYDSSDKTAPLVVTVMDHDPDKSVAALKSQHPALKKHCDFKKLDATAEHIREQLPAHHLDPATPPITCAYVTAYEDRQAFETALKLRDQLHRLHPPVPVVLALSRPRGVADLLEDTSRSGALAGLYVFATMTTACSVDVVQGGSFEPLAEAIHQRWRAQQKAENKPAPAWDDTRRVSASSPAVTKRATSPPNCDSINCAIAPLQDWDAQEFRRSMTRREKWRSSPVAEHQRWWDERRRPGVGIYRHARGCRPEQKSSGYWRQAKRRHESPYMISWEASERQASPTSPTTTGCSSAKSPSCSPASDCRSSAITRWRRGRPRRSRRLREGTRALVGTGRS